MKNHFNCFLIIISKSMNKISTVQHSWKGFRITNFDDYSLHIIHQEITSHSVTLFLVLTIFTSKQNISTFFSSLSQLMQIMSYFLWYLGLLMLKMIKIDSDFLNYYMISFLN